MIIKVKGYLTYKAVIGQRQIEDCDDHPITLIDLIRKLAIEIGGEHGRMLFDEETGMMGQWVAIMVNGCHYNHLPDRQNTVLKDKDEVAIFPPGAGG